MHPKVTPSSPVAEAVAAVTHGVIDCYVRNSSEFQVGNWRSEHQRAALPRLVEQHGYTPAGGPDDRDDDGNPVPYWDEQGVSGESLEKRKKLRAILERVRTGRSQGIACVAFDRLSRDVDLIDGLTIWKTCKDAGAIIITPDKVWHPGEDGDDDMAFIQFWMAAKNKKRQLDNLYEGMVERAAKQPMLRGVPLHGYQRRYEQYVDDRQRLRSRAVTETDPEVADLTMSIFAAFPHQSARSLVAELNAKGEAYWQKRWRKDGTSTRARWQVKQVIRMVHNPLYKGVVIWGQHTQSKRVQSLLKSNQGRAFVHSVEALRIVDDALWAACQVQKDGCPQRFRRGEGRSPRTVGSDAIFGALLRCPGCGSTMYYRNTYIYRRDGTRKLDPSYLCGRYHRQAACGSHHIREAEVLDHLRPIVRGLLARIDTDALAREVQALEQRVDRRPAKTAEFQAIREAKAKLAEDYYVKRKIGEADFDTFMRSWNAREAVLEAELTELDALHSGAGAAELTELRAWIGGPDLRAALDDDDVANWRTLAAFLFAGITPGYEYRGKRRKARIWVDAEQCALKPEVVALLCPTVTPIDLPVTNAHRWVRSLASALKAA